MQKTIVVLICCWLIAACNEKGQDEGMLSQPPYTSLTDSIRQQPGAAELYYRRGSLLYANNEIKAAETDLRKAWELEPTEQYALGVSRLLRQVKPDEALSFLQEALNKLPGSLFIQVQLAQGYKSTGQLDQSLALSNQVITQYPNNIDALLLKAEILKMKDQYSEAIQILEKAYAMAPGDVELVHTLAFDYAENKNPKVLTLSDSLIMADTEKTHAEPHYFKGLYFENMGNTKEALKHFDQAISINYNFLDAHMDKGQTLFMAKRYEEAAATFNKAIIITPTFPDAFYWLAKTQEALGQKEEAKLNYQRAYGLDKTMTEAKEAADAL
ncbi:MAG: tetratricopeptide repeat protein [Flavisolibacter sp.]